MDSTHRPTHLADLVEAAAARHADHPALVDAATGATLTWAEFDAAVSAEARRLAAAGVAAGDRVAIRCAGGRPLAVAVLGALRAGAVAVPLGPGEAGRGRRPLHATGAGGRRARRPADVAAVGPPDLDARGERVAAVGGGEDLALLLHTSAGARRVPVAPRGAGQPGPGGRAAPGPGHPRGPRAADPAALPRLRAGGRSVPGLLGRGDRRAARFRAARRR